jgi:serine/threonine protein kinase
MSRRYVSLPSIKVYDLLKSDVTGAVHIKVIGVRKDDRVMLHVSPVCLTAQPTTEAELKSALRSVLTALAAFHAEGLVHRDIRWGNVLRSISNSWPLADFEEAGPVGKVLGLSSRNHPEAFLPNEVLQEKPYTVKADVWAVGNLIKMWTESHPEVVLSPEGKVFMDLLLKETPNSPRSP